ncbi:methionine adenosyltransferase [Desulfurococcus amylolyticus]|uniref:S-adenosylmethionine synthetase n=1 Tax=Desulfurococcus amylolyticus (strain DSM 18924 / JCM 16383 / VKM B-2413 / 1221n) TaxID=490899 RepID=B8D382_DESA1|nr:methionine adenosyltransferase [Desulfurococcus amylolyticus]ACL10353.1 S-adenosylmethionine synthetase [Desulfurococcus amylolyticus 1221n]
MLKPVRGIIVGGSRNIEIELLRMTSVSRMKVELVERKGVGHPDYIADSASEAASRALSKYYLKEFGTILHHNLDKTLLVGGQSNPRFGGGALLEPIYIVVAGRATTEVRVEDGIVKVPFGKIIIEAVKDWIKRNMRYLDPERHVIVDYMVRKGSTDLVTVFDAGRSSVPLANDTSIGVGYAPLSTLEKLVLQSERLLNSPEFKSRVPAVGEDVKVMGLRRNKDIVLTIAAAIVDSEVRDKYEYLKVKEDIVNVVSDLAGRIAPDYNIKIHVNTADIPEKNSFYLTVTGTSAEHGDDGATGRGNRANGLIPPMRPISLEATAGKNPVNHVGKIYNVVARRIAERVYEVYNGIFSDVYVELLSQIGKPIDQPLVASVKLIPSDLSMNDIPSHIMSEIHGIADEELTNIKRVTEMVLNDQVTLY